MKFDLETIVVFVSFITSFFAVFLSNGIIIGVPAIAQDFAMNNVIQNWVPTIFFLVATKNVHLCPYSSKVSRIESV